MSLFVDCDIRNVKSPVPEEQSYEGDVRHKNTVQTCAPMFISGTNTTRTIKYTPNFNLKIIKHVCTMRLKMILIANFAYRDNKE